MNYFIYNLFHDWKMYALIGLAALAGLNIMDVISYILLGNGFFNLWVVRVTLGAAVAGGVAYGCYLHRQMKRSRQLNNLLPVFMAERRAHFEKMLARDPKFQTFCHECRHYEIGPRRCLLRLHGRQVRIKLQFEDIFSYCLYWDLEDHPILKLTERIDPSGGKGETGGESQENGSLPEDRPAELKKR